MLNLIVAIPCEARPLIRHLRLKKQAYRSYDLYTGQHLRLLVSGVGKQAAACACAWLRGLSEQGDTADTDAWFNIGIAGHGFQPLGTGLLAHRISERSSDQRWYPTFTRRPPCPTAALVTVDQPDSRYHDHALYDMEAAGFYASCSRFASSELIHCFKVVSDNRLSGLDHINEHYVEELIGTQLSTIDSIIAHLHQDQQQLAQQSMTPDFLSECLQHWHFSDYQRKQLRQLLLRRQALMPGQPLWNVNFASLANAGQVLGHLQQQLDSQPVTFTP